MDLATLSSQLQDAGRAAGLAAVGVAAAEPFAGTRRHLEERRRAGLHGGMQFTYRNPARSTDPGRALPGARALVVGAMGYGDDGPPRPAAPSGHVARYARADHYERLRAALGAVAAVLEGQGYAARVLADDNALVDREAAVRAGIGSYGKSSNVLVRGSGSWFVLGSVVTDAPLPPAAEPAPDACGACTRCIDGCPTGAIVGPGVVDARRCLAWLVQAEGSFPVAHRRHLGHRLYGCDDCQEVCPPNRRADRRADLGAGPGAGDGEADRAGAGGGPSAWVELVGLLASDDATLLRRHGRWYVPRRDPRYLRRNALVVLGNVGDGWDPAVESTLRRYLASDDELLVEHATWAASELGRADLVRGRRQAVLASAVRRPEDVRVTDAPGTDVGVGEAPSGDATVVAGLRSVRVAVGGTERPVEPGRVT